MQLRTVLRTALPWMCALAMAGAHAQTAAPPTSLLPGTSALPMPSANLSLPGHDPRQCGTSRWSAICAMGRWSQFARMELRLTSGSFSGDYTLEKPADGYAHTTYREQSGKHRRGGEVLLVSDDAIAYRSREPLPTDVDILDFLLASPNMATQLVAVLLDQGVLGGPGDVTKPLAIATGSTTQFIRTETPNSAALYAPPWRVSGSIRPTDNQRMAFSLRLTFHPVDQGGRVLPNRMDAIDLAGTVSFADKRAAMPGSFDLVGWKLLVNGQARDAVATLDEARRSVGK